MNTKIDTTPDGITELANAIVAQACEDYRMALRGNCYSPSRMLRDVRKFFDSAWYKQLTKLDPVLLLSNLDEEWEEGKVLIKVGRDVECPKLKKHYEFECPVCHGTAETWETRLKTKKRKDGSYNVNYYKNFICKCHIPEQILLRQEVITNEDNQSRLTEGT